MNFNPDGTKTLEGKENTIENSLTEDEKKEIAYRIDENGEIQGDIPEVIALAKMPDRRRELAEKQPGIYQLATNFSETELMPMVNDFSEEKKSKREIEKNEGQIYAVMDKIGDKRTEEGLNYTYVDETLREGKISEDELLSAISDISKMETIESDTINTLNNIRNKSLTFIEKIQKALGNEVYQGENIQLADNEVSTLRKMFDIAKKSGKFPILRSEEKTLAHAIDQVGLEKSDETKETKTEEEKEKDLEVTKDIKNFVDDFMTYLMITPEQKKAFASWITREAGMSFQGKENNISQGLIALQENTPFEFPVAEIGNEMASR